MNAAADFKQTQYAFAAHLRDPENQPAPSDVEDRRMQIYRDLFFNNITSLLAQTFPVLHEIMGEQRWARLIREFYSTYECHTPLFSELPKEFLDWLTEIHQTQDDEPAFIAELAHYEWIELALSLAEDIEIDAEIHRYGDLLNSAPILSPLAWPLAYHYPVHQISPEFQPDQPATQPSCLVVYRDREDNIGFIETNPITTQLLVLLGDNQNQQKTGQELLGKLAEELPNVPKQAVIQGGLQTLEQLRQKDIVLGTLA